MGLIQLGTHCVHNVSVSRTPLQVTSDKVTKCFFDLQKMTGEGEKEKQISNYNYIYLYILYIIYISIYNLLETFWSFFKMVLSLCHLSL